MKLRIFHVVMISCFVLFESSIAQQSGPYLGQPSPGTTPVRFAASKIPSEAWGITFSQDGNECFYSQQVNGRNCIMTRKVINGIWTDAEVTSFSGNSDDIEPLITPDGNRVYFGSRRFLEGTPVNTLHQWYSDKTSSGWSDAKPMDPPLKNKVMMFPSIANNKNLYFTSSNNDFMTSWIEVSKYFYGGGYQTPERLSDSVNFASIIAHPFIALDESYIIFDMNTGSPSYTYYLFISFRKSDNTWTRAISLADALKSDGRGICPFVSRDGKYFFYCSTAGIMWVDAQFISKLRPITKVQKDKGTVPSDFQLYQNYPNPFNPSTTIQYVLTRNGNVKLEVYDMLGNKVKMLVNEIQSAGTNYVDWDGSDHSGQKVSSGIYLIRLSQEGRYQTKKALILK